MTSPQAASGRGGLWGRLLVLGAVAPIVLAGAAVQGVSAGACDGDLPGDAGRRIESDRYVVAYRTTPARIVVGQHFSVELAVCAKDAAPPPEAVRVDAHMPQHRHGMNYRATVTPAAPGRYRADGLLFHMPGQWEFLFDVRAAGRTDRLTSGLLLE